MSEANAVDIRNVSKRFGAGPGAVTALDDVSFEIGDNEFFTLLGPSGCGKTTLLRLMAGFEQVSAGQILLFDEPIAEMPPNRRPINTVFQQYALFPHMTVAQNIGFGLRMLGRNSSELNTRVAEMLRLVQMETLADRRPSQLSGGQQQRVALARALAPASKLLLLDEPLSALDLKLRQAMRSELKAIQRETGITFVFVTHDQEEALTMSDRIAVMSAGKVQQIGAAREIYEAPVNRFVADFIGETNLIDAEVLACGRVRLPGGVEVAAAGRHAPGPAHVSIRPERMALGTGEGLACTVSDLVYLGTATQHVVRLTDGTVLTVRSPNGSGGPALVPGDSAMLSIDPGAVRVLLD